MRDSGGVAARYLCSGRRANPGPLGPGGVGRPLVESTGAAGADGDNTVQGPRSRIVSARLASPDVMEPAHARCLAVQDRPISQLGPPQWWIRTGIFDCESTFVAMVPNTVPMTPGLPCGEMNMRSQSFSFARRRMSSTGDSHSMRTVSHGTSCAEHIFFSPLRELCGKPPSAPPLPGLKSLLPPCPPTASMGCPGERPI